MTVPRTLVVLQARPFAPLATMLLTGAVCVSLITCTGAQPQSGLQHVWFVSPNGSDDGPGTIEAPFRTPERGLAAVTAACSPMCANGAELVLRAGV